MSTTTQSGATQPGASKLAGNPNVAPAAKGRPAGWYIPWLFFAFFGVVIGVNGIMTYFAFSTFTGLQTEQHFLKGIRYNEDLAGARAQAERGWAVDAGYTPLGEGNKGIVAVTMHDRNGAAIDTAAVKVKFIRPTSQGHDFTVDLPYLGEGRYAMPVEMPLVGVWDMRIEAQHATGDYQDEKRIWVK